MGAKRDTAINAARYFQTKKHPVQFTGRFIAKGIAVNHAIGDSVRNNRITLEFTIPFFNPDESDSNKSEDAKREGEHGSSPPRPRPRGRSYSRARR